MRFIHEQFWLFFVLNKDEIQFNSVSHRVDSLIFGYRKTLYFLSSVGRMRVSRVSVAPSKYGVKSFSAQKFANTQKRGLVQTKTSSTLVRRTQERTRNVVTKSKQQTSLVKTPVRSFYTAKVKLADYGKMLISSVVTRDFFITK